MKSQVLALTGSVTLQGAGAAWPSLQPPQKVQELPGHLLHGNTLCIRGCPERPATVRHHGTGLCSASQNTGTLPGQEHGPCCTQTRRELVTSEHFAGASHGQSACAILPLAPWEPCAAVPLFLVSVALGAHPKHMNAAHGGEGVTPCPDKLDQERPSSADFSAAPPRLLQHSQT